MKAKKNHILASANLEQKETHKVTLPDGSTIDLFIGRKYGENNREINPSVCDVLSVGEGVSELQVGDKVIIHHNMITNEALRVDKNGQDIVISIKADGMIYAKVNEDGTLVPLYNNLIGERVAAPKINRFDVTERTEPMKFKIVSTPNGYKDVKAGDTVLAFKYSDYEMVYHFNGRECRAIRISADDILGVFQ